jgi:hypothetical protein
LPALLHLIELVEGRDSCSIHISVAIVLLTPYAELEYRRPRMLLLLVLLTGYLIVVMRPRLQQPRVFFLILLASCISPLISLTSIADQS